MDNRAYIPTGRTELMQVREGMAVYDVNNHKVGSVNYVRFGDAGISDYAPDSASAHLEAPDNMVEEMANAWDGAERFPDELREQLSRHGFIRVKTGLLQRDRVVLPEQISSVTDSELHLSVNRDQLIKA